MLTGPFLEGKEVLKQIEEAGFKAFFVGGCVRDLLLNNHIKDIDITTSASPQEIQDIFPKVIPVGIEHGTVVVRHKKKSYEVTTFRLDGSYTDQRHPDYVKFVEDIDQDLERRDFTMNAMAMNQKGDIIDLYHGREDINERMIRTVGDGYKRFVEDPLRIIRALRFSSQLGFTIESETYKQMQEVKEHMDTIAIERITIEIEKLFAGKHVMKGVHYLQDAQIHHHLPIIRDNLHFIEGLPKIVEPLPTFSEVIALFYTIDSTVSIARWVNAWKCSNKTKNAAIHLINAIKNYEKNGLDSLLIYELPDIYFAAFIRLLATIDPSQNIQFKEIEQKNKTLPIRSIKDLAIDGHDLVQLFPNKKRGPWMKEILNEIVIEVISDRLENDHESLKEWIKCNPPTID